MGLTEAGTIRIDPLSKTVQEAIALRTLSQWQEQKGLPATLAHSAEAFTWLWRDTAQFVPIAVLPQDARSEYARRQRCEKG